MSAKKLLEIINTDNEPNIINGIIDKKFMTPKEKAQELVGRMYLVHSNTASKVTFYFAKECSLIAVDEIINQYYTHTDNVTQHEYWQQVKQEIEKL